MPAVVCDPNPAFPGDYRHQKGDTSRELCDQPQRPPVAVGTFAIVPTLIESDSELSTHCDFDNGTLTIKPCAAFSDRPTCATYGAATRP